MTVQNVWIFRASFFFKRQNNSQTVRNIENALTRLPLWSVVSANIFPNIRKRPQQKPDKYIFIFHRLNVVLLLEKGAYPENSHVLY